MLEFVICPRHLTFPQIIHYHERPLEVKNIPLLVISSHSAMAESPMQTSLALNLLRSICLCLPHAGIKGMYHHTQSYLFSYYLINLMVSLFFCSNCILNIL